jgi:hypothetical protein
MRKAFLAFICSATLTYMACDARADVCPELASAEADVLVAQEVKQDCIDPRECSVAREFLASALERLASARVVCEPDGDGSPFSDEPSLMAGVADYDGDDGAFCAVTGECP